MDLDDTDSTRKFNWRDHLKVHPAADLLPLLPPDELQTLADDIQKNGLQTGIALCYEHRDPQLLDGRNRLDALALLGFLGVFNGHVVLIKQYEDGKWIKGDPGNDPVVGGYAGRGDPYTLALSYNLHRRHLTAEQKRELIAKVLKVKPEQSNRAIAKQVKADDKTVATVRRDLESTAEIPQLTEPEKKPDPQEEEDRKTCVALHQKVVEAESEVAAAERELHPGDLKKREKALAEQFHGHINAAYAILDSEEWLPPDMTDAERQLLHQMQSNLEWQVIKFKEMLALFKWPVKPSEEHRKLAAELKERAVALGCTMKKKGRQYEMNAGGALGTRLVTLDDVSEYLDHAEGKVAVQVTTPCGTPIPGLNNAEAVARYEKTTGTSVARPDNWTPSEDGDEAES